MRWPWVSRRAFDALVDQLDEQRQRSIGLAAQVDLVVHQNAGLLDHIMRMQRREAGLPEAPRQQKPDIGPIPRPLLDHINSFAAKSVRKLQRDQAIQRRKNGEPWEVIMRDVMGEEASHDEATA